MYTLYRFFWFFLYSNAKECKSQILPDSFLWYNHYRNWSDPALPACAGRGLGWHEVLPARNLCRNHCNIFVQLFFLSFTGTWKFYDSSGISGCFRHSEHRIGSFIYCGTPMGHPRCSICNSHRTVCFRNRHHIVCTSQMPGSAAVKIDTFAYLPVQDFGNAYSIFIAQNYGAGKKDRILKGTK